MTSGSNLKKISADGIGQIFGDLSGNATGREIGHKFFAHNDRSSICVCFFIIAQRLGDNNVWPVLLLIFNMKRISSPM